VLWSGRRGAAGKRREPATKSSRRPRDRAEGGAAPQPPLPPPPSSAPAHHKGMGIHVNEFRPHPQAQHRRRRRRRRRRRCRCFQPTQTLGPYHSPAKNTLAATNRPRGRGWQVDGVAEPTGPSPATTNATLHSAAQNAAASGASLWGRARRPERACQQHRGAHRQSRRGKGHCCVPAAAGRHRNQGGRADRAKMDLLLLAVASGIRGDEASAFGRPNTPTRIETHAKVHCTCARICANAGAQIRGTRVSTGEVFRNDGKLAPAVGPSVVQAPAQRRDDGNCTRHAWRGDSLV